MTTVVCVCRWLGRCVALLVAVVLALLAASPAWALPRSTVDRSDDASGKQVHVVYVLPSDGNDRSLDTDGTLENSVESFQTWLVGKTGGRKLRMDRFNGSLDITFFRLAETDAEIAALGAFVRDRIEAELHAAGFNDANKIYAVYYDGTSTFACGGGAYPPTLPGNVAAMYLNGLPDAPFPCRSNRFAGSGQTPTYLEFAMLHEIFHTLGFVPACAPHQHRSGHVSDNPNDLMWAGDGTWLPDGYGAVQLDANHDDYYKAGIVGCLDVDTSEFLTPASTPGPGAVLDRAACVQNPLAANDDGSSPYVAMGFTINYFGREFSKLYVNNNGNVTFDAAMSTFTPFPLNTTNRKIIAPFFADVDTRGADSEIVRYGYGATLYEGHNAFCVNWVNVGYYSAHTDKLNSFQLLIVDRSDVAPGDFDIVMNYDQIQWETGDASRGNQGLGGSSARVGYSNGVDRSFELPGSGTNGALLDSNRVSGLIHNSRNSDMPGRYVFAVRNGVVATGYEISGQVLNDGASPPAPVPGAFVSACSSDGACVTTTSSSTGRFALGGLPNGTYTVSVHPPGTLTPAATTVTIAGADVTADLHVTGPLPPPAGTAISPTIGNSSGLPVVYWNNPLTLTTTGCPGATGSYTITIGGATVRSGPLTEGPAGTYQATVPAFYPAHGTGHVHIELAGCPGPGVDFDIYIDPSGRVVDTAGHPVQDATVTLLRSNLSGGPFVAVADGSAEMALANRRNPDTTDADGRFGWDVIPGYYKVRAEKDGCHAPSDTSAVSVETAVLTIPPPVTDLLLTLECAAPDVEPPEITCEQADDAWHAANVSLRCTVVDTRSGLASASDAEFTLSTHVAAGEETADAATDSRIVCDTAGNCASAGPIAANKVDKKAPSVSITAPLDGATFQLGQHVAADYLCQDGGSGVDSCAGHVANGANVDTGSVGHKTFHVEGRDRVGNTASPSSGYDVVYDYSGFFAPVDNPPTLNTVKAGSAVPVKFSLHGNQGLGVLAQTPSSEQIACDGSAPLDPVDTLTSNPAGLTYDPAADQYVYVWKTASTWAGSCRRLVLRLNDGTVHRATFKFK